MRLLSHKQMTASLLPFPSSFRFSHVSFSRTHTSPEAKLWALLALNVVLQVFDGIATYEGLRLGWGEANPLLVAVFELMGVGAGLLLFKLKACVLLLLVYRFTPVPVGIRVLQLLAAVYCTFSLAPWMAKFGYLGASLAWDAAMAVGSAATTMV
jgi:hypothetical protein